MKLKGISEFKLIGSLIEALQKEHDFALKSQKVLGAGDDCAVLPLGLFESGSAQDEDLASSASADGFFGRAFSKSKQSSSYLLATTDICLEGIHFDLSYFEPEDIGWKSLAVSLSDIASMGGVPVAALISLQIRSDLDFAWYQRIYQGLAELSNLHRLLIVGGDTVSTEKLGIEVSVLGRARKPILRSGAKPGDDIWISGELGYSGAGLFLFQGKDLSVSVEASEEAKSRHLRPRPRVELGKRLEHLASSMIDVSDGLLQDLGHICERSDVSVQIEPDKVRRFCSKAIETDFSLKAGEDFELLFTAARKNRDAIEILQDKLGLSLTRVGEVLSRQDWMMNLIRKGDDSLKLEWGAENLGYDHLS